MACVLPLLGAGARSADSASTPPTLHARRLLLCQPVLATATDTRSHACSQLVAESRGQVDDLDLGALTGRLLGVLCGRPRITYGGIDSVMPARPAPDINTLPLGHVLAAHHLIRKRRSQIRERLQATVLALGPPIDLFVIPGDFQPFWPTLAGARRRHTAQSTVLESARAIFCVHAGRPLPQPLQLPRCLEDLELFQFNRVALLLLVNDRRNGLLRLRRLRDD